MSFWNLLHSELEKGSMIALMYVHESKGSSPGRQGFKMFVSESGLIHGSIGGGVMEFNHVELCKGKLKEGKFDPFEKKLIHQSNIPQDQSGLICSGEQTVGFYYLDETSVPELLKLADQTNISNTILSLTDLGLTSDSIENGRSKRINYSPNGNEWKLEESFGQTNQLLIMGAGHVGLALSTLGHQLGFDVHIYDNREGLNTVPDSEIATFHLLESYGDLRSQIESGSNKYVVIMSYGFNTDLEILGELIIKDFKYLGLMGSSEKVRRLSKSMLGAGFEQSQLSQVQAPIGVQIGSKTPMEIAVSIMAEIIKIKNN